MALLNLLVILMLVYGIVGLAVNYFVPTNPDTTNIKRVFLKPWAFLVTSVFLLLLFRSIVQIGAQEVGVVEKPNGVSDDELHSGWHLILPWEQVRIMDKTVWVYTFTDKHPEGEKVEAGAIWSPTKEGIKMGIDVSVNWKIDPDYASWVYSNISEDEGGSGDARYDWIERNVIRSKTISALSLTTKEYNPQEIYSTKRDEIQDKFFLRLQAELEQYHLNLENVDIREVFYNPDYENALLQRKLAEQEVLRLLEVTRQLTEKELQAVKNKNIQIQLAQGEAEALRIKGSAIAENPRIIELEWIAAWKEGGANVPQVISGSSGNMFMLDLKK